MMPPTDEITLGEVSRAVNKLSETVTNGFKELAEKVEHRPTWVEVRHIETALLERIRKLEKLWAWLGTTVGALVLAALFAVIIVKP